MLRRCSWMLVLQALLACATAPVPVAAPKPATTRSAQVIDQLARRDFAALESTFTRRMQAAVSAEKLDAVWTRTLGANGAYVGRDATRSLASDSGTVELTTLRFERGSAQLSLHWTKAGQIAGLLLRPAAVPTRALELVEATLRGEADTVYQAFSPEMMAQLPAARWAAVVSAMRDQSGPRSVVEDIAVVFGRVDVATVHCRGSAGSFDIELAFKHDSTTLEGLHFVPSKPASTPDAAVPAYANPALYRESAVEIGEPSRALPATFTQPLTAAVVPAVVLVHGSGPADRDETVLANRPFRDLALGLASRGIAVLRYEKRTFGRNAATLRDASTITIDEETIDDAVGAVQWLLHTTGVDPERVIVIGHSQGGMVAARIAQREPQIRGLVLLAAPARPIDALLLEQNRYLASLEHGDQAKVQAALHEVEVKIARVQSPELASLPASVLPLGAPASWWLSMRGVTPLADTKAVHKPLLLLQGDRDFQVTTTDFALWKAAIGGESWATLRLLPGLNHLFEVGEGPSTPAEYARPGQVSPDVIAIVSDWILALPPTAAH